MRWLLVLAFALGSCRSTPPPAPPRPDGLSELAAGRAAMASGDLKAARVHLESALEQSPSLGLARVELLDVLVQLGEHGPAVDAVLAGAQADQPANPRTWLLSADIAEAREETEAAINALQRLLVLTPQDTRAMHRLAGLQATAGHRTEAMTTYRAVLAIDPKAAPSRLALAELLDAVGQLDAAELELTALTRQVPQNALFKQKLEALQIRSGKRVPASKPKTGMRPLRPSTR
jgi:tetratricopeptide (TPR) repeat protein